MTSPHPKGAEASGWDSSDCYHICPKQQASLIYIYINGPKINGFYMVLLGVFKKPPKNHWTILFLEGFDSFFSRLLGTVSTKCPAKLRSRLILRVEILLMKEMHLGWDVWNPEIRQKTTWYQQKPIVNNGISDKLPTSTGELDPDFWTRQPHQSINAEVEASVLPASKAGTQPRLAKGKKPSGQGVLC